MNLPNIISLLRLISVPIIIWLVLGEFYLLALFSFILAGLSDALDGILARVMKAHSTLGSYLDPIADKALLVSMYTTLGYKSLIPLWIVITVIFRDILIVGGTFLLFILEKPFKIKPITISKVNTFIQVITVTVVLAQNGNEISLPLLNTSLLYLVGISTIVSGAAYIFIWLRHINQGENP